MPAAVPALQAGVAHDPTGLPGRPGRFSYMAANAVVWRAGCYTLGNTYSRSFRELTVHAACARTGFIIMTANATVWRADYFTLGSTYSQCTVTQRADKSAPPVYGANCALGQPNACCNAGGGAQCY